MGQNLGGREQCVQPTLLRYPPQQPLGRTATDLPGQPQMKHRKASIAWLMDARPIQQPLQVDFTCKVFAGSFSAHLRFMPGEKAQRIFYGLQPYKGITQSLIQCVVKTVTVSGDSPGNDTGCKRTDRLVQPFCKTICPEPVELTTLMPMS